MKFIYTNDKYEELGVLKNSSIDFEIGKYDVASNDYQMIYNFWVKKLFYNESNLLAEFDRKWDMDFVCGLLYNEYRW